jgi:hypothetical protein
MKPNPSCNCCRAGFDAAGAELSVWMGKVVMCISLDR